MIFFFIMVKIHSIKFIILTILGVHSLALSTFTMLGNHHHFSFLELFPHLK